MKDDYKNEIEHVDAPIVPIVAAGDLKVDGKAHNVANVSLPPLGWHGMAESANSLAIQG